MESEKERVSKDFVALRTTSEIPPDAVETIRDAGFVFAVVPASSHEDGNPDALLPVLMRDGSEEFEVATGKVTLRWNVPETEIGHLLQAAGVNLIRSYGKGGMVSPKKPEGPFELAERLLQLDFITSASIHTVSRVHYR